MKNHLKEKKEKKMKILEELKNSKNSKLVIKSKAKKQPLKPKQK